MRFWDTSAIVPLLADQPASRTVARLFRQDPVVVAWWGTPVECWSAIARLRRAGIFDAKDESAARRHLDVLRRGWVEVLPGEKVREHASRLLRTHDVRAADALQLASALVWAGSPPTGEIVSFDDRLRAAARAEGFALAI